MDSKSDIIEGGDQMAMDLDSETQDADTETASRPATSVISDFSVPESSIYTEEDENEGDDNEISWRPASTLPSKEPLRDSYKYISPRPSAEGPYIVGVDEAGRGPALGPMVYGMAFCPESYVDELGGIGFDDSKNLTHDTRVGLLRALSEDPVNLGWAVSVISPQAISAQMLSRPPVNLNQQSQHATITLLQTLMDSPYSLPISSVFVDALGPAEKYEMLLQKRFPTLKITVRNKADSLFKIVGAASCAAKVTRDFLVEEWVWQEASQKGAGVSAIEGNAIWGAGKDLGSGYPSDPNTKNWISGHLDKTFGFPTVARFSWAPIRNAMEQSGHEVVWMDDGEEILKKEFESVSGANKGRCFVTKELGVSSISAL